MESMNAQEDTATIPAIDDMINYFCISIYFGLHKDSYNYMQSSSVSSKMKSYPKLKQAYHSIQPVKEEERSQDSERDRHPTFSKTLNVSKHKKMNRVNLNHSVTMENNTPKVSAPEKREASTQQVT